MDLEHYNGGPKFGNSLSLDNNTLAVGAPYQDTIQNPDGGAAHVFYFE